MHPVPKHILLLTNQDTRTQEELVLVLHGAFLGHVGDDDGRCRNNLTSMKMK
jgi:hypothetical protein